MVSTDTNVSSGLTEFSTENHLDQSKDYNSLYSYQERIFFATTLSLICVIGIFGNTATIAAVVLSKKLRNDTNVFIVCLAVSDLIKCFGIPLTVLTLLSKAGWPWPEHEWLCSASATLLYGGTASSEIGLAAIAVNRLLLMKYRLTIYAKVFRKWPMVAMVAFILLGPSVVLIAFPLFGIGDLGYDEQHNTCSDVDSHPHARTYELIQVTMLYPISLVTIMICYSLIFYDVRRHFGRQRQTELATISSRECETSSIGVTKSSYNYGSSYGTPPPTPVSPRRSPGRLQQIDITQHKITTNLFTAFCVFFLCVTPYVTTVLTPSTERRGRALLYCALLVGLGACANPIVYALRHPQFGAVFGPMARCRYRDIPKPADFLRYLLKPESQLKL